MTVNAITYGSADGVALYCQQWTNAGGKFDDTTLPTIDMVTQMLADVSSIMATALAKNGFTAQINDTNAFPAISAMVNLQVAELVRKSKSAARFSQYGKGVNTLDAIRTGIASWIEDQAAGFELLGATRQVSNMGQIAFRGQDRRGNDIHPIFERDAFNNKFREYDDPETRQNNMDDGFWQ